MLPSLCVAFSIGLALGSFLPFFPIVLCSVLLLLIVTLSLLERVGTITSGQSLSWCVLLCLGVIYWVWMAKPVSRYAAVESSAEVVSDYTGRIIGLVQHAPHRMTMRIRLDASSHEPFPETIRLTWRDSGEPVFAGDRIAFRAKLRAPTGSLNPRGFDYAAYVELQGIGAIGTVTGSRGVTVAGPMGSWEWWWRGWGQIDRWRGMIRATAMESFMQPVLGFFLGIIIGERGYISDELQEWFMTTGTIHLLSISGSHLGLIAVVVFGGVRWGVVHLPPAMLLRLSTVVTPTRMAILGSWCVVTWYAVLAGAELATMRAWVMISMAFVTVWIGSKRCVRHALAGAAALILVHDPRAIYDISFQLSFLSVLAMTMVVVPPSRETDPEEPDRTKWGAFRHLIREAVVISIAVTAVTVPLVAWYFNQVPWMGLGTNLLAVPFTGFVLVPLGLVSALFSLAGGTGGFVLPVVQEHLMGGMVGALRWCAMIPGGDWRVAAPPLWVMGSFYAGLIVAAGAMASRYHRVAGASLVIVALGGWIWSSSPRGLGDQWRVTFLDVGQGDSALIELPEGQTVLIDGGAKYERFDMGRGVIAPFLWNQGIRRLDHIIATHPQQDHVGGLPWIIRHLEVGTYWHTNVERPEPLFADLSQAVHERKLEDHVAIRGQEILGKSVCRLTVLNPMPGPQPDRSAQPMSGMALNNRSVVTQLACGAHSVVFAADIETEGLHRLSALGTAPVSIVKVPHHGARSSLDPEWIAKVRPRYAIVSVGRHNSYGHPVPEVLAAYSAAGSEVIRTDRAGAVMVTGHVSSSVLSVQTMTELLVQPIDLQGGIWARERENWHRVWQQLRDA